MYLSDRLLRINPLYNFLGQPLRKAIGECLIKRFYEHKGTLRRKLGYEARNHVLKNCLGRLTHLSCAFGKLLQFYVRGAFGSINKIALLSIFGGSERYLCKRLWSLDATTVRILF